MQMRMINFPYKASMGAIEESREKENLVTMISLDKNCKLSREELRKYSTSELKRINLLLMIAAAGEAFLGEGDGDENN